MKIDTFLTCLGYYGVSTGATTSLEGVYSLASGYSNGSTGIFYNLLYPTGYHFSNGQLFASAMPLVNVYNNLINNNILTGTNGMRVGYQHTGNFALLMDIEYSGCSRTTTQKGMVLMTTTPSYSGLDSGFMVGITESNRIYFNTSGYTKTLEKELGTRDFVYVALGEKQFVTIGIFSLNDNKLYSENIQIETGRLDSQDIYVGNFLSANASDPYTGFVGKINQAVIFHDTLGDSDVGICANCSLTTGYNVNSTTYSFLASYLTGTLFSGISEFAVTGTTTLTGNVTTHNGTAVNMVLSSGLTGSFVTGQIVIPLFSGVTIQNARDAYVFQYDVPALDTFSTFSLYFNNQLTSGDTIEVYTYPQANTNIGNRLMTLDWPNVSGVVQLIANGLNETLNIDYSIVRNQVSGESTDDILSYDVLIAPSIVTAYSGYWSDGSSRLLMSGGSYFPPAAQYSENVGSWSGVIKVTGLSGVCVNNPFYPRFGYDLHINGQKLISGMNFDIASSGVSGFVVSLSGDKLPALVVYGMYDETGGGPTGVIAVDDSELAFIPQFSGFRQSRTDVTGNFNAFSYFTGFGEQVWVNGIRNVLGVDYVKNLPCSMITGQFQAPSLDFTLYDSTTNNNQLWNIATPPSATLGLQDNGNNTFEVSISANSTDSRFGITGTADIWVSWMGQSPSYLPSPWQFLATGNWSEAGYTHNFPCAFPAVPNYFNEGVSTFRVAIRFHEGNIIGPWTIGVLAVTEA